MAIALVSGQSASAQNAASASSISVSFPAAVTAGNLIVVKATNDDPQTVSSVAMTGESFIQGVHIDNTFAGHEVDGWYVYNAVGGQTQVTVNYSAATTSRSIAITEWSGVQTSPDPRDQTQPTNDAGTAADAITSPDQTPTVDGELIWAAGCCDIAIVMTQNTPYTLLESESTTATGSEYQIQGAAAGVHARFNMTTATHWGIVLMTFKPASGIDAPVYTGNPQLVQPAWSWA